MDVRFSGITHYKGSQPATKEAFDEKVKALKKVGVPVIGGDYRRDNFILLHGQDAAKFVAEEFNARSSKQVREVVKQMQSSPYLLTKFYRKLEEYYATAKIMGEDAEGRKVLEKEV